MAGTCQEYSFSFLPVVSVNALYCFEMLFFLVVSLFYLKCNLLLVFIKSILYNSYITEEYLFIFVSLNLLNKTVFFNLHVDIISIGLPGQMSNVFHNHQYRQFKCQ